MDQFREHDYVDNAMFLYDNMTSWGGESDSESDLIVGENGHAEYSPDSMQNKLMALFFKSTRGLCYDDIKEKITKILSSAHDDGTTVKNLMLLTFYVRWCRGGKGERLIFFQFLRVIYTSFPDVVLAVVHLIPEYGSWNDLLRLVEYFDSMQVESIKLREKCCDVYTDQLLKDVEELIRWESVTKTKNGVNNSGARISLAAKYAPREGGHFHKKFNLFDTISCKLVGMIDPPQEHQHHPDYIKKKYRQFISKLTKALNVVETQMSGEKWAEIEFDKVPSVCLQKNMDAFLYERRGIELTQNPERILCRENLLSTLSRKGVTGINSKQLFPHTLVEDVLKLLCSKQNRSTGKTAVLNQQWVVLRDDTVNEIEERKKTLAKENCQIENAETLIEASAMLPYLKALSIARDVCIDSASGTARACGMGKVIPMADVSPSMNGTPMHVAIALSILVSEITHESYRDKVLTFHSSPEWHDLSPHKTFVEKVQSLSRACWGYSTDFEKAMKMISDFVRVNNVPEDSIPDLLVISDMQFDDSLNNVKWEVASAKIKRMFHDLGMELKGVPFEPPNIIFWNVRSDTVGFPAAGNEEGVTMLSGYSHALMKCLFTGEIEEETVVFDEDGKSTKTKKKCTAEETFQKLLSDEKLNPLRHALDDFFQT